MDTKNPKHAESCRHYMAGEWELYVFFINKGTKSEGAFGVLLRNGDMNFPLSGESETIETDLGTMRYYPLDSQAPWAPRGWLFADKSMIPRSNG